MARTLRHETPLIQADEGGVDAAESAEQRLDGLIDIAERQQAVAQTILEELAAERAALSRERAQWVNSLEALGDDVRSSVAEGVSDSMAGVVASGGEAFERLNAPLADLMSRIGKEAGEAEEALQRVTRWASGRLLGRVAAVVAGLALAWWLANAALLWWDTSAIGAAQLEKARLQAEIAAMRENKEDWVKAGMLSRIEPCGDKRRPCVRVDEKAGAFGQKGDRRVIDEY